MTEKTMQAALYFVYDGACPMCQMAADLYRVRQSVGRFEVVDARRDQDHPIMHEIKSAGLDLDEGMILKYQGDFYHGDKALRLLARLVEPKGWFNRVTKIIAASDRLSKISYPIVKALRNALIRLLGVGKIKDDSGFNTEISGKGSREKYKKL